MIGNNAATVLAMYYHEPLRIEGMPNPVVMAAARWFNENFTDPKVIESFCNKVMKSFKATTHTPYPTLRDLEDINTQANLFYPEPYKLPSIENFSESQGIHREPPDGVKSVTLGEIIEDSNSMSAGALMKKYGLSYAATSWYAEERYRQGDKYNPEQTVADYRRANHIILPFMGEI